MHRSFNHFVTTTPVCDWNPDHSRRTTAPESSMRCTGRKTYKTDKNKKEAIWPDHLEAWLLQGLSMYVPPPSRGRRSKKPNSQLQRFPKRNKLISQFIYDRTGKARSPKQVGSRIQQLRATCRDPSIRRHLTNLTRFQSDSDSEEGGASSTLSESDSTDTIEDDHRNSGYPPLAITNDYANASSPFPSEGVPLQVEGDWSPACQSPCGGLGLPVPPMRPCEDVRYPSPWPSSPSISPHDNATATQDHEYPIYDRSSYSDSYGVQSPLFNMQDLGAGLAESSLVMPPVATFSQPQPLTGALEYEVASYNDSAWGYTNATYGISYSPGVYQW